VRAAAERGGGERRRREAAERGGGKRWRREGGKAPGHEIKRENKSSKDWRITPCSRRVFGFTPREAVAMITSCEGMAADPAESTVCPTFAQRRACSGARRLPSEAG
jgi:hypothetical protein